MSNETPVSVTENVAEKPKKKSLKDILSVVVNIILVFAMILAALCTYVSFVSASGNGVPNLFGYEFFSVQTDSMYPTLKSGDLVIDRVMQDPSELRPGDIITYWTVINGERVLNTHRINQIYDGGNYLIFETKGDKNDSADSLMVHESEIVGSYVTHVGGVGKILDYLQTSTGFLIVIVLPVAIFFLFHLIQFFRVLFEYQNVKNRLKYYDELGAQGIVLDPKGVATPRKDLVQETPPAEAPPVDKSQIEAELREKIKAEMMAEMLAELRRQNEVIAAMEKEKAAAAEPAAPAEKVVEEEPPAEEVPAGEPEQENAPAEKAVPAEAPAAEEIIEQEQPAEEAAQPEETPAEESAGEEQPAEAAANEETNNE